ncbi:unnamed protein product [Rhizophagus irregularis]|nr:unnamed protein product [Rhizophagus irregularis]
MILSDNILREKAKEFAQDLNIAENAIGFSNGWLGGFKSRNNLSKQRIHGKSNSAPLSTLPELRAELQELISKYDPNDVPISGTKKDKTRITVLLGCNSNGTEKIKPLVIGNAQKPHCLRGINISNLPVSYYWNKKAWMTQDIFRYWIKILDNKFQVQKRQVLILLDNASSHLEPKKKEANNNELYNSDETSAAESSHVGMPTVGSVRFRF